MKHGDIITRTALWRANNSSCFYCGELLSFRQLDIDHVIPRDTEPAELQRLVRVLQLGASFSIDCPRNLVPSHHDCNMRKSNTRFSESSLRFYLETWAAKQPAINREIAALRRRASAERLLTSLGTMMEQGLLSMAEVTRFLERNVGATPTASSEPLVIAFGINLVESAIDSSPQECDRLENELKSILFREIPSLFAQTEASLRTGETLSIRIAFWNIDLNRLQDLELDLWEVLEVAPFSEIYDGGWDELFPKAVIGKYQAVIHDDDDPIFRLGRCPQCGSKELKRSAAHDYAHDEQYYLIRCDACGWSDWTQ